MKLKSKIKLLLPKFILNKVVGFFYGWSGNYKSWDEAANKCTGYNNDLIFKKVKDSLLKVKNGEAVYERDSVLFDHIIYSHALLNTLKKIAVYNRNSLNVLDFGGSLGSSYYQNKSQLTYLSSLKWNIVEQPHFVTEGCKTFSNDELQFYYDVESCLKDNNVNVVLLSSVIQYIPKPYELINKLIQFKIPYFIFDRTPLLLKGNDRITIQKVPKKIYDAQYPCWLINEDNLIKAFESEYELVFNETNNETIYINNAAFKTLFFKSKGVCI